MNWKDHERRIAKRLGGTRMGPQGRSGPDVTASLPDGSQLAIECKARKTLPATVKKFLSQITPHRTPQTIPLVIMHEHGAPSNHDVVCLTFSDFLRILKKLS